MSAVTDEAAAALTETSTEALLTIAYALTHRIHEATAVQTLVDLRAQRDLITAEVTRRTGEDTVPTWGPRQGATGPVHQGLPDDGFQSWCGRRAQFRHRVLPAASPLTVTCPTCLARVRLGRPLARGARS